MSGAVDLQPAYPAILVSVTAVVLLLAQAFAGRGRRAPFAALSLAGLVAALVSVVLLAEHAPGAVMGGSLTADSFSLFMQVVILAVAAVA
ncbi:MAG TPA: hypothetical protein VEQ10_14995, partial [Vicinamibacteria bacterium]|nr:hypothetical protein [Vicinamibacteria bacterium]